MARTLFDCVGDWFEDILSREFPDFEKVNENNGSCPDFFNGLFHAEAKAGYVEYGAQVKRTQVEGFSSNGEPIVYFFGFHNLKGLRYTTETMSPGEIDRLLKRKAGLNLAFVVSNDVVKKIWGKDHHVAKQNPAWAYLGLKPRHLESIMGDRKICRGDFIYSAPDYYGIDCSKLLLQRALPLEGRKKDLKFGLILDKRKDGKVIEYLDERGLVD